MSMSLESPNRRVGQLKRWLAKPPRGTKSLLLSVPEGEVTGVLARYDKAQAVPELAYDIEALVNEHADEAGVYAVARLEWLNANGEALASKVVRGRPTHDGELDGSQVSQAAQAQRHTEAMTRLYVSAHSSTVDALQGLVTQLADIARNSLLAAQQASQDAEVARAETAEALRSEPESSEASDRVMRLAEVAIMSSMGGKGGPPPTGN